jgi:hypothetical protein
MKVPPFYNMLLYQKNMFLFAQIINESLTQNDSEAFLKGLFCISVFPQKSVSIQISPYFPHFYAHLYDFFKNRNLGLRDCKIYKHKKDI